MKQCMDDVREFHKAFGQPRPRTPKIPSEDVKLLRSKLMLEELVETLTAIDNDDMPGVADGLADLIYVACGCAISYGIDLTPVWDEVQRANMSKLGGGKTRLGKIIKPKDWRPPDIHKVLFDMGWAG